LDGGDGRVTHSGYWTGIDTKRPEPDWLQTIPIPTGTIAGTPWALLEVVLPVVHAVPEFRPRAGAPE
jgi:hypothetical protein